MSIKNNQKMLSKVLKLWKLADEHQWWKNFFQEEKNCKSSGSSNIVRK